MFNSFGQRAVAHDLSRSQVDGEQLKSVSNFVTIQKYSIQIMENAQKIIMGWKS